MKRILRAVRGLAGPSPRQRGAAFYFCAIPAGLGATAAGLVVLFYGIRASLIDLKVVREMPKASQVYDYQGQPLGRFFDENRIPMPEGPLPKVLAEAIVATEDQRFWYHPGVDPLGVVRAMIANLLPGGVRQGASTITQQLARNSIRMMQRTYDRKLLEIFLALRIERQYSKEEILRHYLDRIYYGGGLYGAETASRAFFGKGAHELSLGEAALLAGMISGPNSFSPWGRPSESRTAARTRHERALEAKERALDRMVRNGFITEKQAAAAKKEPLVLRPRPSFAGTYAMEEIRLVLKDYLSQEQLDKGGLQIFSTIDYGMQDWSEKVVQQEIARIEGEKAFPKKHRGELEAAFLALDPATGAVRAVVGGRNYQETQFNRATQARRQAGSTLKPLIYAAAFAERGYSPASWIENTKFNLKSPSGPQRPQGGTSFLRVNDAVVKSDNYAAVRMGNELGPELFVYYAQQAGIAGGIPPYPSSYLGACDVSLLELVQAYAVFANGGVWNKPFFVIEVKDENGKVLYRHEPQARRVFSPEVACQVTGMLENVTRFGTGSSLRTKFGFQKPAAGKTGTTNDYVDAWWVGYTSSLCAGAWVGYDKPDTIISNGYGGRLALPIWAEVMRAAEKYYPMNPFPVPAGLEAVELDGASSQQLVYLRADQRWHRAADEGGPSTGARRRSFWERLFDW